MRTYYEILELDIHASKEIIDKAYRTLVKKYHPDLKEHHEKTDAETKIKEINEAYEVLSNTEKKQEYDKNLKSNYISMEEYNLLVIENSNLKKELYNIKSNYINNNYNYYQNNNTYHENYDYKYNSYNNLNEKYSFVDKIFNKSKSNNNKNKLLKSIIIIIILIILFIFVLRLIKSLFINSPTNPIIILFVAIIIIISLK